MIRRLLRMAILLSLSITAGFTPVVIAQMGQAEITGEVRDPSAAVVPSAKVTVTEVQTNQSNTLDTSRGGDYTFGFLKPGHYTLVVQAQGFRRSIREGIQLATGERLRLDVELVLGNENDVVTVNEGAPLLRTESGELSQVINNRKIVDLPLISRSFIPLVALVPGVALPPGSSFPRINGGRPRVNEYLFDGISVLQPEPGQVAFLPVIDAIQEFKVITNSPPAEFGRFNGGVINLTTKSGTNDFHG